MTEISVLMQWIWWLMKYRDFQNSMINETARFSGVTFKKEAGGAYHLFPNLMAWSNRKGDFLKIDLSADDLAIANALSFLVWNTTFGCMRSTHRHQLNLEISDFSKKVFLIFVIHKMECNIYGISFQFVNITLLYITRLKNFSKLDSWPIFWVSSYDTRTIVLHNWVILDFYNGEKKNRCFLFQGKCHVYLWEIICIPGWLKFNWYMISH